MTSKTKIISSLLVSLVCMCIWSNETDKHDDKVNIAKKEVVAYDNKKVDQESTLQSFKAEITAYTSGYESTGKTPSHPAYGITSSGRKVRKGIVAADTRIYPYGTKFKIEGLGEFEVWDTGGDINGNRIDIWFEDLKEAQEFGRQYRKVTVLFLPK